MKPLLIIGHPLSGLESIETILQQHGMSEAKPSRIQQLTPSEVSNKILQAGSNNIGFEKSNFHQVSASKIWNELALDLFLANTKQDFWGWSDTQSIFLLNYWRSIEPNLKYLLVYNSPETSLTSLFQGRSINKAELKLAADKWENYNKELISFHYNNPDNCLLVHAGEANKNITQFINLISTFIGMNFKQKSSLSTRDTNESHPLNSFFAHNAVQHFPFVHESFEELQSIANLPLLDEESDIIKCLHTWNHFQEVHQQQIVKTNKQLDTIKATKNDNELIIYQINQLQEELDNYYLANDELEYNNLENSKENELVILQLHQLQEELENYYIENKKLIKSTQGAKSSQKTYHGAANRIKERLSYQLGKTMLRESKSIGGWIRMPLALLKASKQFNQEKPQREARMLPPISEYQDIIEAEKTKQHLSYRLGKTMITHSKTPVGWILLPWKLHQEIHDFNKNGNGRK
ncbi:MAG: hypothetical protein V3U71_13755 [Cocleimonas sp.]